MKQDARSVLKLEKLVFDKLLFERKGFSSENNFELKCTLKSGHAGAAEIPCCGHKEATAVP